jgi:phthalate 4,5-cis-dihydrodiol dehydrogenase
LPPFDPRQEATTRFATEFNATIHASPESLAADPAVDVVYVASPAEHHAAHVVAAAAAGSTSWSRSRWRTSLAECQSMVDAAERAGVRLVVGHSHSFDRPILRTRELIASGAYGAPRMIAAQYYTDFLYRLRRPGGARP